MLARVVRATPVARTLGWTARRIDENWLIWISTDWLIATAKIKRKLAPFTAPENEIVADFFQAEMLIKGTLIITSTLS